MGGALEHRSGALQTQGLSHGEKGPRRLSGLTSYARRQKWLRLRTLAGEIPPIIIERWREIVQACGQRVVVFEVGQEQRSSSPSRRNICSHAVPGNRVGLMMLLGFQLRYNLV